MRTAKVLSLAVLFLMVSFSAGYAETRTTVEDGVATTSDAGVGLEVGTDSPPSELHCLPIKHDQIGLDGCPEDWFAAGIEPVIVDEYGDHLIGGRDILTVRIADRIDPKDGRRYLYGLIELAASPDGGIFALVNADRRRNTGCLSNIGGEFGITMMPSEPNPSYRYYIGDARDCAWGSNDYPGALQAQVRDRFVEFRVPAAILAKLSRGPLVYLEFFFLSDPTEIGRYYLRGVGGSLEGTIPFGGVCWNMRTNQITAIPAGVAKWNCHEYGFKASPGDTVFTGATGIVPVPSPSR